MNNFSYMRQTENNPEIIRGMQRSHNMLLASAGIFETRFRREKQKNVIERVKNWFARAFCRSKKQKKYALTPSTPSESLQCRKNRYYDRGYYSRRIPALLNHLSKNESNFVCEQDGVYYTGAQVLEGLKKVYVYDGHPYDVVEEFKFDNETHYFVTWSIRGRGHAPNLDNYFNRMNEALGELCRIDKIEKWLPGREFRRADR